MTVALAAASAGDAIAWRAVIGFALVPIMLLLVCGLVVLCSKFLDLVLRW
jgi:hypothetical protein